MDNIVIDLETFDPYLATKGTDAHCRRWGGYVFMCGIYQPDKSEDKIHISEWTPAFKDWLTSLFDRGGIVWWGANLKYDLNWLFSEGVLKPHHTYNNRFRDILIDAALIDETQPPNFYSLDEQAKHYNLPQKPLDKLLKAASALGIKADAKTVRSELYRLPRHLVAEYLEHDIVTPWLIAEKQAPIIVENKLEKVVDLESKLLPILSMMERQGVPVDVAGAEKLYNDIYVHIEEVKQELRAANNGLDVNLNTSNNLTQFILDRGHKLPTTPAHTKERPRYSTAASVLEDLAKVDPLLKKIVVARKSDKIAKDFCKRALLENHHNGRIHANINQIISFGGQSEDDSKGVRFGRLSMSNPNLQQVPKRDSVEYEDIGGLGTAMRNLFIADEGCQLLSGDFSAQEPRWIVHWAETWKIPGAKKAGDQYRLDPKTDYHSMVANFCGVDRAFAKIINLGKGYEMGKAKLIRSLMEKGADASRADEIIQLYETNFPHVSGASRAAMDFADKYGYVRTFVGRKLHFNLWEPVVRNAGPAMPYDAAYQTYVLSSTNRSPIRRAYVYRAFNRIVQGSSADQTKLAMCELWYTYGLLPTLQVHDELISSRIENREQAIIYKNVMENCVQLTIPCLTDIKLGPTWARGTKLEL